MCNKDVLSEVGIENQLIEGRDGREVLLIIRGDKSTKGGNKGEVERDAVRD